MITILLTTTMITMGSVTSCVQYSYDIMASIRHHGVPNCWNICTCTSLASGTLIHDRCDALVFARNYQVHNPPSNPLHSQENLKLQPWNDATLEFEPRLDVFSFVNKRYNKRCNKMY